MEKLIDLNELEIITITGGTAMTKDSSFGEDVGYICGWICRAMLNGAAMIQG